MPPARDVIDDDPDPASGGTLARLIKPWAIARDVRLYPPGPVDPIMVLGRAGRPEDEEARYDNSESTGSTSVRAVIIYESMFGNTHAIAVAIAKGLKPLDNVVVVPVVEAGRERLGDADLLVVGGPTHFHGMSRPRTRKWAVATAQKPKNDLLLDCDAQGPGVRDWLRSLGHGHTKVAAFDTRFKGPAVLRGRASKAINRKLRKLGFETVAKPESFFVTLENHLKPGEEARAQEWGKRLAARVLSNDVTNGNGLGRPPTSKET